jgi:hypothetical protein
MNTTIYTGPADGWHLTITARAAVGRWALKFTYSTTSGRKKDRHTTWIDKIGWGLRQWQPLADSETRAIAEAWLKANPVPVPNRVVTATVVPGLDFRGVKP